MDKITTENNTLSPNEIEVMQTTWALVSDSVEMATDFYNRLFFMHPGLRPLFKEDIRLQARKFTAHISYLIKNLNNWEVMQPDIADLGKRHVAYEVTPPHYDFVRDALFYALRNHLKTAWDETTACTWHKFYSQIAMHMMSSFHKTRL